MSKIDELFKSYCAKCKELGIKPGTKESVFGSLIEQEKIEAEKRESIEELSKAKKAPALKLSETAIKASSVTTKLRILRSRKPKIEKSTKSTKSKLSDEKRAEHRRDYIRIYRNNKRRDQGVPQRKIGSRREKRRGYFKTYYKTRNVGVSV